MLISFYQGKTYDSMLATSGPEPQSNPGGILSGWMNPVVASPHISIQDHKNFK